VSFALLFRRRATDLPAKLLILLRNCVATIPLSTDVHFQSECCSEVTDICCGSYYRLPSFQPFQLGAPMKKVRTHLLATAAVVALSGSAFAADMGLPMKAPPAPAPIPYATWQGWYIGGAIGAARLNTTATLTAAPTGDSLPGNCSGGAFDESALGSCSTGTTGFTAGVQVGYDWQSRYFVYGVLADWTWTGLKHTVAPTMRSSLPFFTAKVDWLATFRGRMGLAVDDTLVYFTGGLALGDLRSSIGNSPNAFSGNNFTNQLNKVQAGWVAGAGVEHKLNQNWSMFGEFLYYDFGHDSASGSASNGNSYSTEFTHEIFQGKLGVNYRF
jgi:outer membrane immunogenic protein